ncbi:hypothetical protein [Pajaroellobacter abortibovis]|uniref:Farnesoic acid O-methyl transferase domain-containing protein n=1 Tax=Pajaroellobacter abortibovis TaxID=1882918 RepID=A0A1L6MYG5_9BACT|nr:hypothetical protein [Pajaroellobacter abortibovis]APS00570.1 hypothetical protein BCY86_07705 [Pajaroellobacter abortibovis]
MSRLGFLCSYSLAVLLVFSGACKAKKYPLGPSKKGGALIADPPLTEAFVERFEVPAGGEGDGVDFPPPFDLARDWRQNEERTWSVKEGWLCAVHARNHGIWLKRTLPANARIEFDAVSSSSDGDLKVEAWGDGRSGATSVSYMDATSYLLILGGWKNSLHVLARINEHGEDRKEIVVRPSSSDLREQPVIPGKVYHFYIERTDGKTVRWQVNGVDLFAWTDPEPLVGDGHDHFGFNDWDAQVCFDNLRIEPL